MMTKSDTIEAIQKLNPTVNPDFLAEFANDDLTRYLHRLTETAPARRLGTDNVPEVDQPSSVDAALERAPF